MSTLDAALFAIGAQFGKYGLWFKTTKMQEGAEVVVVRNTRYAITGVTVAALMLSLLFSDFLAAAFDLISLLTVISVAVLCALVLKLSNKQFTAVILIGMVCFACMTWGGLVTSKPLTTLYPSFALVASTVLQTLLLRAYKHFTGSVTST